MGLFRSVPQSYREQQADLESRVVRNSRKANDAEQRGDRAEAERLLKENRADLRQMEINETAVRNGDWNGR